MSAMTPPPAPRPVVTPAEQLSLPLVAEPGRVACRRCGLAVSPPFGYAHEGRVSRAIHPGCALPGDTPPFDEARWKAATAVKGRGGT